MEDNNNQFSEKFNKSKTKKNNYKKWSHKTCFFPLIKESGYDLNGKYIILIYDMIEGG